MKKTLARQPAARRRSLPAYRELAKALEPLIRKMLRRSKEGDKASS